MGSNRFYHKRGVQVLEKILADLKQDGFKVKSSSFDAKSHHNAGEKETLEYIKGRHFKDGEVEEHIRGGGDTYSYDDFRTSLYPAEAVFNLVNDRDEPAQIHVRYTGRRWFRRTLEIRLDGKLPQYTLIYL